MKSARNNEPGFTLLELLAAMAVLSVMIVMLFAAFNQASKAWLQAESRVETFTQARVSLDLMARELAQAITTSNISFLGSATNVAFIAPVSTNGDLADIAEVVYIWTGSNLVRQVTPASNAAWNFYGNLQNWPAPAAGNPVIVADNVGSFNLTYVYTNGVTVSFWNSTLSPGWSTTIPNSVLPQSAMMTNRPPAGVQIYIETVDSRAATKLQAIAPSGVNPSNITPYTNLYNQVRKSFTTFVAIPNGQP